MGGQNDSGGIIGTRGLVFLGAGASQPLGKLMMAEFIDDCKKAGPPWGNLFESIVAKQKDLEYLLEQLDALASMKYLHDFDYSSINPPGRSLGIVPVSPVMPKFPPRPLPDAARDLLNWTKRRVFEHYGTLILDDTARKSLSKLFDLTNARDSHTVVFTTNYDPAVEEFCRLEKRHLLDGFVRDTWGREDYWDRSGYDTPELAKPGAVVLFKLHGSTTWVAQGGRVVKARPIYADDKALAKNVLIYPATKKVAIDDPYFTAYDYLEKCLTSAKFCVFVGYSFRDYDMLMRLRAAQAWSPHLKVIVLDPAAKRISKMLKTEIGVEATPIDFLFHVQEDLYLPRLTEVIRNG